MSSNHGRLCRNLIGSSFQLKSRFVIDPNVNLEVGDARVRGTLEASSAALEGNVKINGDLEVCGNVTVKGNVNTTYSIPNVSMSGLVGSWLHHGGGTTAVAYQMALYDGETGQRLSVPILPMAGEAIFSRCHWVTGATPNTLAQIGFRGDGTTYLATYDTITKSTTYIDTTPDISFLGTTPIYALVYDPIRGMYLAAGRLSSGQGLVCLSPNTGVNGVLTPSGMEGPGEDARAAIILADRVFVSTLNWNELFEFSRVTGAYTGSITLTLTFTIPPGGNEKRWPQDDQVNNQGGQVLSMTLNPARNRMYLVYGFGGQRLLGYIEAATESALSDLLASGTVNITISKYSVPDRLTAITQVPQ